jgi:hypothetical protein
MAEMPFPVKNCDTRSEKLAGALSVLRINERSLHNSPHGINKPFQHLHLECMISSGPFGHKFEVDEHPDVEEADQHSFDLGL